MQSSKLCKYSSSITQPPSRHTHAGAGVCTFHATSTSHTRRRGCSHLVHDAREREDVALARDRRVAHAAGELGRSELQRRADDAVNEQRGGVVVREAALARAVPYVLCIRASAAGFEMYRTQTRMQAPSEGIETSSELGFRGENTGMVLGC